MRPITDRFPAGLDLGLLVLRVTIGGVMVAHGFQKLLGEGGPSSLGGMLAGMGVPLGEFVGWLVVAIEILGGLALVVGLLTPLAALGQIAVLLGAAVLVHSGAFFNQDGGWEYTGVLMLASLAIIFAGPGRYSLDATLAARRGTAAEPTLAAATV